MRTKPGFLTYPEYASTPWLWAPVSFLYLIPPPTHTYIYILHTQYKHILQALCTHTDIS